MFKRYEICSNLTIKTPEWHHWHRSIVCIVNFEHISHIFLKFLLLTLNKLMLTETDVWKYTMLISFWSNIEPKLNIKSLKEKND